MALEPQAMKLRPPEEYAAEVDVGCKPGEAGHTAPPCLRCEGIRSAITVAIGKALQEHERLVAARQASALSLRVDTVRKMASAKGAYDLLSKAFRKLRVVLDMDRTEAGRIAHEAWIGLMLERGFHPFQECPVEKGCPSCDNELMPWESLPEARRLVREAAAEALFAELKSRAGLDELEQADREAARAAAAVDKERAEQGAEGEGER